LDDAANTAYVGCAFVLNETDGGGGGAYEQGGAASFTACLFVRNEGSFDGGGGVYVASGAHSRLTCCAMTGNHTSAAGGAIFVNAFGIAGTRVDLVNCTVVSNTATFPANPGAAICGGVAAGFGSNNGATLSNTILWNNSDLHGAVQSAQVQSNGAALTLDRCIVHGWTGSLGGIGNSGVNPLFSDLEGPDGVPGTEDDHYEVAAGSPCIDSGDNAAVPAGVQTDYLGRPRFVDDPQTPDTGAGAAPIVDRGALEFQGSPCYANCDTSTAEPLLNINDFVCFANRFAAGDPYANCDGSTAEPVLNINDFVCFVGKFAAGCS
jgi:hypothetical protein